MGENGSNTNVISLLSTIPSLYYKVSNRFIKLIKSINGHSTNNTPPKLDVYNWEGVSVSQHPILMYLPYVEYNINIVTSTIDKISYSYKNQVVLLSLFVVIATTYTRSFYY